MGKTVWWRNTYLLLLVFVLAFGMFTAIAPLLGFSMRPLSAIIAEQAMSNINFGVSCLGGLVLYLVLLPQRRSELLLVFLGGAVLEGFLISQRLTFIGPRGQLLHLGVGFFPWVLVAILWRIWGHRRQGEHQPAQKALEVLSLVIAMPLMYTCGSSIIRHGLQIYDPMLMAADSAWGTLVSFHVSRVLRATLAGRVFGYIAYFYLALFMLLAQLICYKRSQPENSLLVQPWVVPAWLYIIAAMLGTWSYGYLPAVGTEAYCGTGIYPNGPIPAVISVPHAITAPPALDRNCMPSLHLSWILCAFFAVCRLKKSYLYVGSFLVVAVWLSAFSVGNHWLSDFLASLPFVTLCLALASFGAPWRKRLTAAVCGGLSFLFLVWLYKNQAGWIMNHTALYLWMVCAIDALSWWLCLTILPTPPTKQSSAKRPHPIPEAGT